jgi:hypothetical protein
MHFTFKNFNVTCMETNAKHSRFKRRNSLRNRSTIYAKIHTYLHCFWFTFYAKIRLSQNPRTCGHARFLRRNFLAPFVIMKQIYDLR